MVGWDLGYRFARSEHTWGVCLQGVEALESFTTIWRYESDILRYLSKIH
jgi:hypothetical protein